MADSDESKHSKFIVLYKCFSQVFHNQLFPNVELWCRCWGAVWRSWWRPGPSSASLAMCSGPAPPQTTPSSLQHSRTLFQAGATTKPVKGTPCMDPVSTPVAWLHCYMSLGIIGPDEAGHCRKPGQGFVLRILVSSTMAYKGSMDCKRHIQGWSTG